jgi:hypothetical protein
MARSKYTVAKYTAARPTAIGLLLLSSTVLTVAAHAQPADRYLLDRYFPVGVPGYATEPGVTVRTRARPEYESQGVRAGSFVIRPEASESIGYNDNVLASATDRKGSMVVDTQAALSAASDWGRNSLGGALTVQNLTYPSASNQNQTTWSAALGGTYEIGRDQIQVGASYLSAYQTPSAIGASNGISQPAAFDLVNARVAYVAPFGRFALVPSVEFTQLTFAPAVIGSSTVSQSFQNRDNLVGAVQGRYEFAPLYNGIVEVRGIGTNFTSKTATQPTHNSNGAAVLAGIDYTSSSVWRYRVLVGYELREYEASEFKSRSSPIAEAGVVWNPTGLTTVTGRFIRTLEDTGDQFVSGYTYTSAQLVVDHEYLRNVLLRGYIGYQNAAYNSTDASQNFYLAGASVSWLLNRNLRLGVSYDFINQSGVTNGTTNSPVTGGTYNQNIGLVSLRFQL